MGHGLERDGVVSAVAVLMTNNALAGASSTARGEATGYYLAPVGSGTTMANGDAQIASNGVQMCACHGTAVAVSLSAGLAATF